MKHKEKLQNEQGSEQDELHAVPHTGFHVNLIAAIVCILLAAAVWFGVMNTEDTDYLTLQVMVPQEGYTYTLSTGVLQVSGKVAVLKGELEAKLPDWKIVIGPNEAVELVKYLKTTQF